MDIKLKPQPKDRSIASLRTPLLSRARSASPNIGPDMGKLAAKGGGASRWGSSTRCSPCCRSWRRAKARTATAGSSSPRLPSEAKPPAATASKPQAATASNPRLLLQPDRLHQARQLRVLLRDQSAELLGRQERRPHAEVLGCLHELRRGRPCFGSSLPERRSPDAACRAARRCRARRRARRRSLARARWGRPASAGSRFCVSAASRRSWPCFTGAASAAGNCTTALTWPPSRLGTTCAAANGTSFTSTPAALKSAASEMCVWLPTPEWPTLMRLRLRLGFGDQILQRAPGRIAAHRDHHRFRQHARHRRRTPGSRSRAGRNGRWSRSSSSSTPASSRPASAPRRTCSRSRRRRRGGSPPARAGRGCFAMPSASMRAVTSAEEPAGKSTVISSGPLCGNGRFLCRDRESNQPNRKKQTSHVRTSFTSTRRPSRADLMPASSTASERGAALAVHLRLAVAAHRGGELVELLDDRVVLLAGHGVRLVSSRA